MKRHVTLGISGLIFLFVFVVTISGFSSGGEKKVNLKGTWKFSLGDNSNFAKPGYSDKDWEEIYVPSSWNDEGFRRYSGYAWYRKSFEIDFKDNEPLYLELGRIDDVDEVFVNGKRIGSTGGFPPDYSTAARVNRVYLIPTEFLQKGKVNVLAVRVYDEGGEGGIIGKNNIGIFSYGNYYESGYPLLGNWKFHLFDDPAWSKEDVKDSDWENIVVPAAWEDQGFREYDGFAWYRKKFKMPATMKTNDLVLLLGRIDDMDEVFLNGTKIGGTGNIERKWARNEEWRKPRTYFIPEGLLRAGKENVIAVRVYDQEGRGGIYEGPITLIPRSEYKSFWRSYQDEHRDTFSWWTFFEWE